MSAIEVIKRDGDLSEETQRADEWLDEALAESFPASDPLPMSHGQAEPADLDDSTYTAKESGVRPTEST